MYLSITFVAVATIIMAAIAAVMTFKEDDIVNAVINIIRRIAK